MIAFKTLYWDVRNQNQSSDFCNLLLNYYWFFSVFQSLRNRSKLSVFLIHVWPPIPMLLYEPSSFPDPLHLSFVSFSSVFNSVMYSVSVSRELNLYFTSESRESLVPLSLSLGVKTILSWICKGSVQIQRETWKIRRCGPSSPKTQNLVISRCCFA